ncbi:MAG: hypothetical protein KDD15_32460 [Lewinella sp.]|nr:hypothetical protein [Lewinella sp.]
MKTNRFKSFGICIFHTVFCIYSCNGVVGEGSLKFKYIQLNCERRDWTEIISIPIEANFIKEDTSENFWPLSPEDQNDVFVSSDEKMYVIIKYCENHYEGYGPLNVIADDFLAKIQDTGATKLSSDLKSGALICEHIVYNASFGHDVYLATKIIKAKNDIVTIFGMNIECCSEASNRKLYSIIQNTKLSN